MGPKFQLYLFNYDNYLWIKGFKKALFSHIKSTESDPIEMLSSGVHDGAVLAYDTVYLLKRSF